MSAERTERVERMWIHCDRPLAECPRGFSIAEALLDHGATQVSGYITHGVLSGGAVARIMSSRIKELVITDSILPSESVKAAHNIRILPIAGLLGEAIARTAEEQSVSSLFY